MKNPLPMLANILRRGLFRLRTPLNTSEKRQKDLLNGEFLKLTDRRYRLLLWFARRICRIPYTVKFDKPGSAYFYAVAFAATPGAANRVRGNDMLIERLKQAETINQAMAGNRKGRRAIARVAKNALKKEGK